MKQKYLVLSMLVAGLMILSGAGLSQAGELKISGFADIILVLSDEVTDDICTDADGGSANCFEGKTFIAGEVDFEKEAGPVTFRLDLDIPSIGNEAQGLVGAVDIGIEQAKFVWAIPAGEQVGLSLTGGAFNAPIGFEAQDAPDMFQTSNGQLFGLVPSNLAGFMLSGSTGPVALDVYFVNEWLGITDSGGAPLGEENSVGGLLTITPIEQVSVALGYITSPETTPPATDENVFDVVLTGTISPMPEVSVLGAFEYLTDENNDAFAIVVNGTRGPYGLTLRYDSVDCDAGSSYLPCLGDEVTPISFTVAGSWAISDNLGALLEYRLDDLDNDTLVDDSFNTVTLEFVATF